MSIADLYTKSQNQILIEFMNVVVHAEMSSHSVKIVEHNLGRIVVKISTPENKTVSTWTFDGSGSVSIVNTDSIINTDTASHVYNIQNFNPHHVMIAVVRLCDKD